MKCNQYALKYLSAGFFQNWITWNEKSQRILKFDKSVFLPTSTNENKRFLFNLFREGIAALSFLGREDFNSEFI